jgi:hypothetical protein
MNESLTPNARAFASRRQIEIGESLGSGKDGLVLIGWSKARPSPTALKAHRFAELYEREKKVYQRLAEIEVEQVLGFNVPELLGHDDDLLVLEMTIVERPFVLDFAGAYLDIRPEFAADVWADWEADKKEQFEGRWPVVQKVLSTFEEFGVYLLDVSPSNIAFVD